MDIAKLTRRTIWLVALTSITVVTCYFFIDRQLAVEISQHHLRSYPIFKYLSKIPELYIVGSVTIYFYIAIQLYNFGRWTALDQSCSMFANTIAITYFLKDFFKHVFARTWPETWINNNPSLIHDNIYGFYFFRSDNAFGAFPSGHAAALIAGTTMLWLLYPRFKVVYVLIVLASLIGILGMNYHFLGDIIGGGLIGYLVATLIFHITKVLNVPTK